MLKRFLLFLSVIVFLSISAGCANRTTATLTPGADLGKIKNVYIVQIPEDKQTHVLIKENLEKRGFTAITGPEMKTLLSRTLIAEH